MSMRARERLRECVASLRGDPRASVLSALAIALAVTAFSAVTSIADGMTRAVGRHFESLGTRTLVISSAPGASTRYRPGARDLALLQDLDDVARAALSVQLGGAAGRIEAGDKRAVAPVNAVGAGYFEIDRLVPIAGALPEPRRRQALIGAALARRLFGDAAPVGRHLRIGGHTFVVCGVLPDSDEPGRFAANDESVFVPLDAAADLPGSATGDARIVLEAAPGANVEAVGARVLARLQQAYGGRFDADDLQAQDKTQLLAGARRVIAGQAQAASWVALLTTAIAGLGVMNMMFLGSDRRRAEIGLRRALGAARAEIAAQFVGEALLLCACAIPLGLLAGRAIAEGVRLAFRLDAAPVLTAPAAALAAFATALVVLVFALAPAWRAARTDPAAALRSE